MSRFKGGDSNLSPLKLQLTTNGSSVVLTEWRAALQCEQNTAHSRPVLSRPSIPGTTIAKTNATCVNGVGTAASYVISQFNSEPSLPAVASMLYNMPSYISYQYQAPERAGLVAYDGQALLLYALASPGGAWDGELVWEEK